MMPLGITDILPLSTILLHTTLRQRNPMVPLFQWIKSTTTIPKRTSYINPHQSLTRWIRNALSIPQRKPQCLKQHHLSIRHRVAQDLMAEGSSTFTTKAGPTDIPK